jgi:hypothetical protein
MTASAAPRQPAAPPLRRWGGARRETTVFRLAIAVIALHVADDSFVEPPPGTSAGDHLVSGLVPLAVLAIVAGAYPRLRAGWRAAIALAGGVLGAAAGIEAAHYTATVGPSGDDFTGLLALAAGAVLLGLGAIVLWRTRSANGTAARRYGRRALIGLGGIVALWVVVLPIGFAYVTTHVGRAVVPRNALGVAYEDVSFRTSDGLKLVGWYVPSRNGAAVIVFPGRRGPQAKARMLARHGYGVLLFDRRGEGRSEGEPNAWGWGGTKDVTAAIAYLHRRPDVQRDRIGGLGLSVGGEMMLETAAGTDALKAVVSEGAGARMFTEEMDQELPPLEKAINAVPAWVKQASLVVFSNQSPPTNLEDLTPRIAPRAMFLIAAPNAPTGEDLNRGYYRAAGRPKILWEIPESKHVGGLEARPREYERRVVAFFDRELA